MRLAELRSIRRRCERRLAGLPIPVPLDPLVLAEGLSERRGRPILVRALPELGGRTLGVWLAIGSPPADVIAYAPGTTPLHRDHIILHELSHILCDHAPRLTAVGLAGALFPDIGAHVVQSMLQRAAYSDVEELEAELLASLIQARAAEARPTRVTDLARRLETFARGQPPV